METQEAVNIAQWQLQRIKFFMDQAQAAWHSLNSLANGAEVQDALDDYHNQEGSIGHCLRWGCQAAEDLVDLCNTPEDINARALSAIDALSVEVVRGILADCGTQDAQDGFSEDALRARLRAAYEGGAVSADEIITALFNS